MQALATGDRDRFLATEAENRRAAGMPPFSRLVALILSCRDEGLLDRACGALARAAPRGEGLEVLGPAPAPLAVLRRQHRRRFLLRAARSRPVQPIIAGWLGRVDLPAAVRLKIDVDPYSFH
jgi:primosomal protein N' (replication factor Y)